MTTGRVHGIGELKTHCMGTTDVWGYSHGSGKSGGVLTVFLLQQLECGTSLTIEWSSDMAEGSPALGNSLWHWKSTIEQIHQFSVQAVTHTQN
jgi:hypothetical protein